MNALDTTIDKLAEHIAHSDILQVNTPVGIIVFTSGKIAVQYSLSPPRPVANQRAAMALIEMEIEASDLTLRPPDALRGET